MKNFTNNFKQFTSRLSARWLIMALMMLVGTSSAWAANKYTYDYIFLDLSGFTSWASDGATFKVGLNTWDNAGGGTMTTFNMTKVDGESYIYYAKVSSALSSDRYGIKFTRCSSTGSEWNSFFSAYNSGNCGKPNNWNSGNIVNLQDVYCISAPTFGEEVEVGQSATSSGSYLYAGVSTIPEISNNSTEFQYVAGSSSITTNGLSTITVKFTPSSAGDKTGTLKFGSYLTTSLSGKGKVSCTPPDAPSLTNPGPLCGGSITLPESANEVNLKWYDAQTGGNVVSNTEITATGTYWAAAVAECESTDRTAYTVTINPIPEVNSLLSPLNICIGSIDETDLTTLSHVEVSSGSTAVWYTSEDGVEQAERANLINGGTYWVAAENSTTGCKSTTRTSFTININALPQSPSLGKYEYETCAHASNTVSLNELAGVSDVIWYLGEEEVNEEVSIETAGIYTYTAKAVNVKGCQSATGVDFKLTVNSLPTITSISASNDKPVLFEDVVLTADGVTSGAEVKWYLGNDVTPVATGTTYTVTSETTGDVIVKAKAFLGDCESVATTKTVIFSAENCTPEVSNDIQITFTHPAKNNNNAACQYWGFGDLYYSTNNGNSYTKVNPSLGTSTSGSITRTISNLTVDKIKVYFQAYYEYTNCRAKTTVVELDRGNSYSITISSDQQGNGNGEKVPSVTKTGSLTHDPEIKAPAVKMVSAEYDEVNDKIVAKGAVYKTGCGVTFWGFQYSKDGQTWGTADADFIRPSTNNSLTDPGEFDYSFTIPNAGGGDIYYIRAYALNNYNGSYALSNAVYSATSLPIEIPSSIIESATISLVNSEGVESDVTEVCPQSIVYLKVSYVGGDFKDYEAADNFPGTNLELVNHDKANNYAIFSYTATATGVANITISNDNTSIAPTNGVSITLKDVAPVSAPMISISQATICENGSATITVNNPIVGLTYTLYKETTKIDDPVIHNDGDLTFNVTEAGSYTVRAEESICHNYANSMAVELKVVTNDVKIGLAVDKTTVNPWQPLKLTVTPPEGYAYTIDGLADVVYTQSGDVYTIKIPRPNDWSPGNSGDPVKTMPITFSAKIQVTADLTCGTSSVNVTLADTEENCK